MDHWPLGCSNSDHENPKRLTPQSLNFDHIHGLSQRFPPLPGARPGAHLSPSTGMVSSLPIPLNTDACNTPNNHKGTLNKSTSRRRVPTTNHTSRHGLPTNPNSYSLSQNSNVVSNAHLDLTREAMLPQDTSASATLFGWSRVITQTQQQFGSERFIYKL